MTNSLSKGSWDIQYSIKQCITITSVFANINVQDKGSLCRGIYLDYNFIVSLVFNIFPNWIEFKLIKAFLV